LPSKNNYSLIGDVAEIRSGFGFPIRFQGRTAGDLPFAKVGDISKTVKNGFSEIGSADHYVDYSELKELKAKTFPVGTIVFAKIGEAIRQNFRAITSTEMLFDNNVMGLVPKTSKVNAKFLFHFLKSIDLYKLANATSVPSIRRSDIEQIRIYLPPLPEQKRIAEVLDKADALREKRRLALQKLDTLLQSVFLEMFGDPVKNPKGWNVEPLRNLIDDSRPITYGILKPGDNVKNGVPYIRVVDMKDGEILVDEVRKTTKTIANEYKRSTLKSGDLLMSIRGHVGRLAIVPEILEGANITQDTARLAPNNKCNVHYLHDCLKSVYFQRELRRYVKGVAVQGINLGDVKELKIPVPPLTLQEKFASISLTFRKSRYKSVKARKMSENLFQSLQQRAFKGELFSNESLTVEPQEGKVRQQTSLF